MISIHENEKCVFAAQERARATAAYPHLAHVDVGVEELASAAVDDRRAVAGDEDTHHSVVAETGKSYWLSSQGHLLWRPQCQR